MFGPVLTSNPAGGALSLGGTILGDFFKTSSAPQEIATMGQWFNEALSGKQSALDLLVTKAGLAGGTGIAATQDGKNAAKQAISQLLARGAATGPTGSGDYGLPPGVPNLLGQYVVNPAGVSGGPAYPSSTVTGGGGPLFQSAGAGKTLGQTIADFFGLGPAAQQQVAVTAGTAAGQQVSGGIVKAAVILAIVVLVVVLVRRR